MPNCRKPDNVHQLAGTYDVSRHGKPEDKPDWSMDLPIMPDYLNEYAQQEWKRTMQDAPGGVLTKTDTTILAQYCIMVSAMVSAQDPDNGKVFLAADHTQLRMIQQELGFTPISRGKIGGAPKNNNDGGPQVVPR